MWTVLTSAESIEAAQGALQAEYNVEGNTLRHDLHDLIEKLVEHGLAEVQAS
jgi:hypothetical protein